MSSMWSKQFQRGMRARTDGVRSVISSENLSGVNLTFFMLGETWLQYFLPGKPYGSQGLFGGIHALCIHSLCFLVTLCFSCHEFRSAVFFPFWWDFENIYIFRWFEVGCAIWAQTSQISASQIKAPIGSVFQKYVYSSFMVKMRIDLGCFELFWCILGWG